MKHRRRPPFAAITALVTLLLAACGDDAQAPPEQTGILHAGALQGVDFQTATRSGATDANGRFTYLPGEQVRFSVGGIEIGSAAGAPEISLFTLAGLTPPTSERILRRELDIAVRTNSRFVRAMNIDLLLLGLDADGNPDNGLDVRNRQSTLAGVALDFDLPFRQFQGSLYRRLAGINHNLPPAMPLVHLYGSLGLKVPVHAMTRLQSANDYVGLGSSQSYTYLANGALATDASDFDGDGVLDWRTTWEYGANLRNTRLTFEQDRDFDGLLDVAGISTREFNGRGDLVGAAERGTSFFNVPLVQRLESIENDSHGRPRRQVIVTDAGDDGIIEMRSVYTTEYDANGNGVSARWVDDDNADGVDDTIMHTVYLYDSRNRLLLRRQELDADANGTIDAVATATYEYGAADGPVRAVDESDFGADGVVESRYVYRWTYDRDGNPVSSLLEVDANADGIADAAVSAAQELDRFKHVTRAEYREDLDADGISDYHQVDTRSFDAIGNVGEYVGEYDADGDGLSESRIVDRSEFGEGGELLGAATQYDWDNDGLSDQQTSRTATHALIEDGVLHLAQWYFMRTDVGGALATVP